MTDKVRFPAGTVLADKYVVEHEIASGGMGVVLAAVHRTLGHRVAIKVLHECFASRPETVERFAREARLAASLRSDNVVRIHDVDSTAAGVPFIVMEYLEGEDLGAVLGRAPLSVSAATDLLVQTCEALSEAHALGIVHRDLKPENLFLARRGARTGVKVVDFGISKAAEPGPRRLTTENERFGTPVYMSPEQLQSSANVDARTDIWALGVVLFELLTQRLPFDGESLPELVVSIVAAKPRALRAYRSDAPERLEAVIQRCLARNPADRPQTVDELAILLVDFVEPTTASGRYHRAALAETMATPDTAWVPAGLPVAAAHRRLPRMLVGVAVGMLALVPVYSVVRAAQRPDTLTAVARVEATPAALVAPAPAVASATPLVAGPVAPLAPTASPPTTTAVRRTPARPATRATTPTAPAAPASDYDGFGGRR